MVGLLEVKTDLRSQCSWRDIVRSAKRRQEIVERHLIREVHRSDAEADSMLIAFEEIVFSERKIE